MRIALLVAILGGAAVVAAFDVWQEHESRAEKNRIAACGDYQKRLAAFQRGEVTSEYDAKGDSQPRLQFMVSQCRRHGYLPG